MKKRARDMGRYLGTIKGKDDGLSLTLTSRELAVMKTKQQVVTLRLVEIAIRNLCHSPNNTPM